MNLTSPEKKKKETPGAIRAEWLEILLRGKFIPAAESDLFDYYKQKVETLIHSLLPGQLELAYRDARFSIVILFIADPLSELALAYTVCALRKQNNQEEAIRRYAAFTKDYRRVMNEEYGIAFADIKV